MKVRFLRCGIRLKSIGRRRRGCLRRIMGEEEVVEGLEGMGMGVVEEEVVVDIEGTGVIGGMEGGAGALGEVIVGIIQEVEEEGEGVIDRASMQRGIRGGSSRDKERVNKRDCGGLGCVYSITGWSLLTSSSFGVRCGVMIAFASRLCF